MATRVIVSVLLAVLMIGTTAIGQEVKKPPQPSDYAVKVIAPNGGETWTEGTSQMISWEIGAPVVPDSICIRLVWTTKKGDNAVKENRVLGMLRGENPGKWEWDKVGPVGDAMKIRVEAFFPEKRRVRDESDVAFAIVAQGAAAATAPSMQATPATEIALPVIKILSPSGGEIWKVGSKHVIKWSEKPVLPKSATGTEVTLLFNVALSRDGGKTWEVAADHLKLTSSDWEWTIPDAVSDNCRVRVTLLDEKDAPVAAGESDADFRIVPSDMGVHHDEGQMH
jgi:hypothetical protein